jgi:GNAT superfamily N-acetyltransferase
MHWAPEQSTEHRQTLERLTKAPGFGISLAKLDGDLVGFAYGRTLDQKTAWWNDFLVPVDPEITTERTGRTFAVIDFGVTAVLRGKGLGRRLLASLLDGRPEERATLAVEPAATNSLGFYEHLGWRLVGRLRGAQTDTAPFFDILVLPLSQASQ